MPGRSEFDTPITTIVSVATDGIVNIRCLGQAWGPFKTVDAARRRMELLRCSTDVEAHPIIDKVIATLNSAVGAHA